jgi:hypothetical protein
MLVGFLLGVIVAASLTFWRRTRDVLFLGFAASFFIEGLNRAAFLGLDEPHEGSPAIYGVRLLSYLLILAAIIHKNRGGRPEGRA